uniref:Serpentine receptor class gamma n=1 Tax=Caenorhabditis tropicalis TaxID=1561998 RepID=A0A1I7TUP8_9PELO
MKSVKWTMLNLHVCSSIVDFSLSVIVQPYYLGSTWAWLPLGIGVPLGIPYTVLISVTGTAFLITGVAVIALFENQFYLLFAENTWWRYGRILFLGVNYLVSILYIADVLMAIPDQAIARAYIFRVHPEFRLFDSPENPIQVAVAHDDSSMGTRQMLMTMMILCEGLGFPIILSFKMNNIGRTSNLTQNTTNFFQLIGI